MPLCSLFRTSPAAGSNRLDLVDHEADRPRPARRRLAPPQGREARRLRRQQRAQSHGGRQERRQPQSATSAACGGSPEIPRPDRPARRPAIASTMARTVSSSAVQRVPVQHHRDRAPRITGPAPRLHGPEPQGDFPRAEPVLPAPGAPWTSLRQAASVLALPCAAHHRIKCPGDRVDDRLAAGALRSYLSTNRRRPLRSGVLVFTGRSKPAPGFEPSTAHRTRSRVMRLSFHPARLSPRCGRPDRPRTRITVLPVALSLTARIRRAPAEWLAIVDGIGSKRRGGELVGPCLACGGFRTILEAAGLCKIRRIQVWLSPPPVRPAAPK